MAANPPTLIGVIDASDPPAIITSASPRRMISVASPIACADAVQAVHVARFGPRAPKRIDTCPAARLMMDAGMKNGEIRRGPPVEQLFVLPLDRREPADARRDEDADLVGHRRRDGQLRVVHRELAGRERVLDEDVGLLDVFLLHELQGIEASDLPRNARRERRRIEVRDRRDAAAAGKQRVPVRGRPDTDRRDQTDAGDDHSPGHVASLPRPTSSSRGPRCTRWPPSRA